MVNIDKQTVNGDKSLKITRRLRCEKATDLARIKSFGKVAAVEEAFSFSA